MPDPSPLKVYWPHPKVAWNGRGISEAWAEAITKYGFEPVQDPKGADLAFFSSDSQLDPLLIGTMPTIAYCWGWPPERFLEEKYRLAYLRKIEVMRHCTRVLTPSPTTMDQLATLGLKSLGCLPGIDTAVLGAPQAPAPKKDRLFAIGWLSRLTPYKGLGLLIEACSLLEPRPEIIAMGPGDPEPYAALAKKLEVPVTFTSPDDPEKVRLLREVLLLAHPSLYEGWGLPPLEAIYLGTPVIAQSTPHLHWLLQDGAAFAETPPAWANAISDTINHYDQAAVRTLKTREMILRSLTMDLAAQRLWAHFHQAMKDHYGQMITGGNFSPTVVKAAYEANHRRDWAYSLGPEEWNGPARFDPTWARHWRASRFIRELQKAGATRILDVGCSSVYPTIFALARFDLVCGFDISEEALRQAREIAEKWGVSERVLTRQGRGEELTKHFAATWDGVVLGEVLEHVKDPALFLDQAYQVCTPGGVIVLSTPLGNHHWDPMHVGPAGGGWDDTTMEALLSPYASELTTLEKIAEEGEDPSCYLAVIRKNRKRGP